jgi:hypothetical protein
MRRKKKAISRSVHIDSVIHLIRGERVILDADLAKIYGIPTSRLNEAVKRNRERFPDDFLFQLSKDEFDVLKSQIAISNKGRGGRRTLPYAFNTEVSDLPAAGRRFVPPKDGGTPLRST